MSQVIDDATSTINNAYDDASTLLDDNVPLGKFLNKQIARVRQHDIAKTKIYPSKTRGGKELPSSSTLDSPSVISIA